MGIGKLAFYESPRYIVVSKKVNNIEYKNILNLAQRSEAYFNLLTKSFAYYAAIIPVLKMNSIYLIRNKYKAFDFVACNYAEL